VCVQIQCRWAQNDGLDQQFLLFHGTTKTKQVPLTTWAPNQIRNLGDDIDPPEAIGHQTLRVGTKKNSITSTQQQQHSHQIGMTSFSASKHVIASSHVSCLLFFWVPVGFALQWHFNVFIGKGFGNRVVFKQAMSRRPVSKSSINGLSFGNSTARSASSSDILVAFFSLVALTTWASLAHAASSHCQCQLSLQLQLLPTD